MNGTTVKKGNSYLILTKYNILGIASPLLLKDKFKRGVNITKWLPVVCLHGTNGCWVRNRSRGYNGKQEIQDSSHGRGNNSSLEILLIRAHPSTQEAQELVADSTCLNKLFPGHGSWNSIPVYQRLLPSTVKLHSCLKPDLFLKVYRQSYLTTW